MDVAGALSNVVIHWVPGNPWWVRFPNLLQGMSYVVFLGWVGAGITGEGQGHADRDAAQGHRDRDRQVQTQSRAQVQGQVAKGCHHMRHSTGTKTGTGHMSRDWLPKHVIIWDTAQGQRQGQDTGAGTGYQSMSSYDIFNISITISISISIYNLQQGQRHGNKGTRTGALGQGQVANACHHVSGMHYFYIITR